MPLELSWMRRASRKLRLDTLTSTKPMGSQIQMLKATWISTKERMRV